MDASRTVVVFGGTGFIGSHVVEQLAAAGEDVVAVVRPSSDTTFLATLDDVTVEIADLSDDDQLLNLVEHADVVYNCTAAPGAAPDAARAVEINLTRRIATAAVEAGVRRVVQLSTILVYGFDVVADPADEFTKSRAQNPGQQLAMDREQSFFEAIAGTGTEGVVLRPASTIGARDQASVFARLLAAHAQGKFPLISGGRSRVSLVDTRDVGGAMAFLADHGEDGEIYLLRGFEATWADLKSAFDDLRGGVARASRVPAFAGRIIATVSERVSRNPTLTTVAVRSLSEPRVWDDVKIRAAGFTTRFGRQDSIRTAYEDIMGRTSEQSGQPA